MTTLDGSIHAHQGSVRENTGVGTKLHSVHRSKVTFEVDQYDQTRRSGRSVRHYGALRGQLPAGVRQRLRPGELRHDDYLVDDACAHLGPGHPPLAAVDLGFRGQDRSALEPVGLR